MHEAPKQELLALVVLWSAIGYCWFGLLSPASSLLEYLLNPAYFAMVAATISAAIYSAISIFVANSNAWRRLILALFLAGMPLIYLSAALVAGDEKAAILESVGVCAFLPMAAFGYRRSVLVLGAGIAAHGIAWDLWHHHHAIYIETWYPAACLIIDLAFFIVAVAHKIGGQPMAHQAKWISQGKASDAG